MNNWRFVSGRWWCNGVLSWAPTLTFHDPNPPMPLENVYVPPPAGDLATKMVMIGCGRMGSEDGINGTNFGLMTISGG